jgi:hypothetical protein
VPDTAEQRDWVRRFAESEQRAPLQAPPRKLHAWCAMRKAALLVAFAVLFFRAVPAIAETKLVSVDWSYYALRLESEFPVVTWEDGGVRVFVARQGAVIRQGPVRLAAPSMVVWFDEARSARPDVRAAIVKVYAEGVEAGPQQRRGLVHLAEGGKVRQCGALMTQFRSTVGFSWDAPLTRSDKPVPSVLFGRAETTTRGLQEDTVWEEIPPAGPKDKRASVEQLLTADQVQGFWTEEPATVVYIGDVHGTYENLDFSYGRAAIERKADKTRKLLEFIARNDPKFAPDELVKAARSTFVLLQQCWQKRDYDPMKPLMMEGDKAGVMVNLEIAEDLPPAPVDPKQLYNAVYNLVNNAIPETPPGGSVTVCLSAIREGEFPEGKCFVIRVADTGNGMPEEVRRKLFTDDAVKEIAAIAQYINDHTENIGARRLHTVLEKLLEEISFASKELEGSVVVDGANVKQRLEPIMSREDLSKYIL